MNREELLAELEVERYASPPRNAPHSLDDGPTARWNARQRIVDEVRRLYHDEKMPTGAIARRMRLPRHEIVDIVEGWTS